MAVNCAPFKLEPGEPKPVVKVEWKHSEGPDKEWKTIPVPIEFNL